MKMRLKGTSRFIVNASAMVLSDSATEGTQRKVPAFPNPGL